MIQTLHMSLQKNLLINSALSHCKDFGNNLATKDLWKQLPKKYGQGN